MDGAALSEKKFVFVICSDSTVVTYTLRCVYSLKNKTIS
jgi:hypothetical protein